MNKQEAVSQIMEIKAVLPKQLQAKLIEAVKVLASFKMISMDEDLPYNHPHLMRDIGCTSYGPLCLVKEEGGDFHIDSLAAADLCLWTWQETNKPLFSMTHWLPLRALYGPNIMDEYGNELKFE